MMIFGYDGGVTETFACVAGCYPNCPHDQRNEIKMNTVKPTKMSLTQEELEALLENSLKCRNLKLTFKEFNQNIELEFEKDLDR